MPKVKVRTRRRFLAGLSGLGAATLLPTPSRAAEGPLETTVVRLARTQDICGAPQYVAKPLLRAEGFTDIRYVDVPNPTARWIGRGEVDFSFGFASALLMAMDAGAPIVVLAGLHVGCVEVFGSKGIHSISHLKGKRVGVEFIGSTPHVLLSIMAAQIGLDPVNDIRWITGPKVDPMQLFIDGQVDAFVGSPPWSLDLRERHIGEIILRSAVDRPWAQYFCCMLGGNLQYVRDHPVATKRVSRAILKATDLCATEPEQAARHLVEGKFTPREDFALQTLSENPYDKWRDYDPEDTIRFYALRLREVGFIKSSPQKIIAENTDWRFLDELKRELKA
jgi:NitT/TauT family transport system substrate-binding protein